MPQEDFTPLKLNAYIILLYSMTDEILSAQLLIAFECGLLVLWDLKAKCAELRWQAAEAVKSLAWHYEGKYFVSSHTDGSICSWPTKPQAKPQSQVCPHGKLHNHYPYINIFDSIYVCFS